MLAARWSGLLILGAVTMAAFARAAEDEPEQRARALVGASCVGCHAGERPKGGLDLERDLVELIAEDPELGLELVLRVEEGEMPPPPPEGGSGDAADQAGAPGRAALGDGERAELVQALRALLGPPRPPRAARLRRLNRFEYDRCVEDLLGVRYDSSRSFPTDAAAYGFDTVGDVMFLTDLLVEKYFEAAVEIVDALEADPAARARIEGEPEEVLRRLLSRAFRRPPTEDELAARAALVRRTDDAPNLRPALISILVSPEFLFRVERDHGADLPRALDDHELATRLAFLCWAQGPDDALLARAAAGELSEEAVLAAELERLLDDPRSRALADGFAAQWLGFRDIRERGVDFRVYKGFNDGLKRDLYEESARSFDWLVRADRPLAELVTGDWTFLNKRLAQHYGLPAVDGGELRRVTVEDARRGGILGQGSVLTLTSYPTRTSPVLRGAWILERLLSDPTPPPPPNIAPLAAPEEDAPTTVRERLELHRADAACAVCHDRIDPLGFALEGFDGVGRIRAEDDGKPLDERGVLPDGRAIEGVPGLKAVLGERPEALARTFLERLFVYAIGRPPEAWDAPALDFMIERGRADEWRTRALIRALVLSAPFRQRGV